MWTPFRKTDKIDEINKRLELLEQEKDKNDNYNRIIEQSKCAIIYYVGADDDIVTDFKFDGQTVDNFISLFAMINTGQLHDILLEKIVMIMRQSGATTEQVNAFLNMVCMVTEAAIKDNEEEDEEYEECKDDPVVLPLDVFKTKEDSDE